jgi:hypothetical protein
MNKPRTDDVSREILDVKAVAAYLRVSTAWIYTHKDELPHRQIGGLYFFSRSAIQEYFSKPDANRQKREKMDVDAEAEKILKKVLPEGIQ